MITKEKIHLIRIRVAIAAAAALIIGALAGILFFSDGIGRNSSPIHSSALKQVLAQYPDPIAKNVAPKDFMSSRDYSQWKKSSIEAVAASAPIQHILDNYYFSLMREMLSGTDENTICSPLSIYIALSMLAEVTDGNSRQQILDALGINDTEALRQNISAIWQSNFADTPVLQSLLANSMWLNKKMTYNEDTLKTLADHYFASSFVGDPQNIEMNNALQQWVNDNTGDLLTEYAKGLTLDPYTALALVSTVYLKATWKNAFPVSATNTQTFHGLSGDTSVDMMHSSSMDYIYIADTFMAIGRDICDGGKMYFFLPNEDVEVDSLLSDSTYLNVLRSFPSNDNHWYSRTIRASIPKFKVSQKTGLLEKLVALGITDILDYTASDFTPLLKDSEDELFLSRAEHAATLEIDEKGVLGVAYTFLGIPYATGFQSEPPQVIDFILDRPFMFVLTGADGSILFSGIVKNIEK